MTRFHTWSSWNISTGTLSLFKLNQRTPLAHRVPEEQGITFFVRPQNGMLFFYDTERDAYICPTGKQLRLNTLHRSASGLYWLYLADKRDCRSFPLREKCLSENGRRGARKLERGYFTPERQRHLAHRYDADYKDALKKRQFFGRPAALNQIPF